MWMNGANVGSAKSSTDISDSDNTNPLLVGGYKHEDGTFEMYRGRLDDFRIFRRCLSGEGKSGRRGIRATAMKPD